MLDLENSCKSLLLLETGDYFYGYAIGSLGVTKGELIFNTSMFGYQEILTDPSYRGQIVTFTAPYIGNVGINKVDAESDKPQVAGLVTRNFSLFYSNCRAENSLQHYLQVHHIVGIAGVDTRAIVKIIKKYYMLKAVIINQSSLDLNIINLHKKYFGSRNNSDLTNVFNEQNVYKIASADPGKKYYRVVIYNFGVKNNIIKNLIKLNCEIIIVPWNTPAHCSLEYMPDGILLSNGPGDPCVYQAAIIATMEFLKKNVPIFGICLGHQILGLAGKAKIVRMINGGHHGSNHPIINLQTNEVFISSQNHNFTICQYSLPKIFRVTHKSLFDHSIQGIEHIYKPAFSFQGHPEASPGPHDLKWLFCKFLNLMHHQEQNKPNQCLKIQV